MTTVAEASQYPEGQIFTLDATVKSVYPPEQRQGQNGTFTTQNFVVEDHTGSHRAGVYDPAFEIMAGQKVKLFNAKMNRWVGKNGNPGASFQCSSQNLQLDMAPQMSTAPPPQQPPPAQTQRPTPTSDGSFVPVSRGVGQFTGPTPPPRPPAPAPVFAQSKMTYDEAGEVIAAGYHFFLGHGMDQGEAQRCAVALFIAVADGKIQRPEVAVDEPPAQYGPPDDEDEIPF